MSFGLLILNKFVLGKFNNFVDYYNIHNSIIKYYYKIDF